MAAGHMHFELGTLNFVFDVVLLAVGFLMAVAAAKIPSVGAIGKTVRYVVTGAIILGLAHLVETGLDAFLKIPTETNELIHRCIILIGFAFLFFGIKGLADSLGKLRTAQQKR